MRFEWDMQKNASNWAKHRVNFRTAQDVFDDSLAYSEQDRFVNGEERWWTIGQVRGQLYYVAFAIDDSGDDEIVRIISARKATRTERNAYERGK
jgi:uncharacterized DUF497 family protein